MANVAHSSLTGSDLHEPKGVAAATANKVYVTNGSGSGAFTAISTFAGAMATSFYHCQETQANGVDGASLTNNSWNTRALASEITDDLTLTLSSSQLSLVAGTYYFRADAVTHFSGLTNPVGGTAKTKLRIRNITDGTTLVNGLSNYWFAGDTSGADAEDKAISLVTSCEGRVVLAGTKTIELQNYVSQNFASSGAVKAGKATSSGENEVYANLIIIKTA